METKKVIEREQLAAFGKHLRMLRESRGYTGVQFAAIIGVDKQFLSRLELGQSNPRLTTLIRLSQGLEMNLSRFLNGLNYSSNLI